jgi:hypothetical protein
VNVSIKVVVVMHDKKMIIQKKGKKANDKVTGTDHVLSFFERISTVLFAIGDYVINFCSSLT